MKVTITLKEPARSQAEQALVDRGLRDRSKDGPFYGPVFEGNLECCDGFEGFLGVRVYANATDRANYTGPTASYYYPNGDIARLKIEP